MAGRGTRHRRAAAAGAPPDRAALRARVAARLPEMLEAAIAAHRRIADPPEAADAKSFAAAQTAAKAALGHIAQLLDLAETVLPEGERAGATTREGEIDRLIAAARQALAAAGDAGDAVPGEESAAADGSPDAAPDAGSRAP